MSGAREAPGLRADALAAWQAGLAAADATAAVSRILALARFASWRSPDLVIATGKAAAAMARGVGAHARGLVLAPRGAPADDVPAGVEVLRADHPLPTPEGLHASERVLAAVAAAPARSRILYLVSGGTSALFEAPREGVSADSLIETYRLLWGAGLPIGTMNVVRRAMSRVKGGGLLAAAPDCEVLTLAVSDVIDDDPATIGSGPSVACDDEGDHARELLRAAGLWPRLPGDVRDALGRPRTRPERAAHCAGYEIVCSNASSVAAARAELARREFGIVAPGDAHGHSLPARLEGDAVAAAGRVAAVVKAMLETRERRAFVLGGETTVAVGETAGRGGRNLHLAAAVAVRLAGVTGFALVSAGTDGADGNSDAAGGVVDGSSAARAAAAGHELGAALARFDTASALAAGGDLLTTGATGTNVGDVLVAVSGPR